MIAFVLSTIVLAMMPVGRYIQPGPMGPRSPDAQPIIEDTLRRKPAGNLGGRTEDDVMSVLRSKAGIWRACYQKELNRARNLRGTVTVGFKVDVDGRVVFARVVQSTTQNAELEECVRRHVQMLRFKTTGKEAVISYPFMFTTR